MTILKLQDIGLSFGNNHIFKGLNFSLKSNEFACIKTGVLDGGSSLLRIAAGLIQPDFGNVLINNKDFFSLNESERFFTSSYCFEDGGLISIFTNYNNIKFPLRYNTSISENIIHHRIMDAASELGIEDLVFCEPHQLNDVQTRLIKLLRALAIRPKFLLIDELQGGMSKTMREQVIRILLHNQQRHGFGIVMTITEGDDSTFAHYRYEIKNKILELQAP